MKFQALSWKIDLYHFVPNNLFFFFYCEMEFVVAYLIIFNKNQSMHKSHEIK